MTQPTHRIEPGQEYETYNAREGAITRIRVIEGPRYEHGLVTIATIAADGRELRRRTVGARQFHADYLNRHGEPRRTGYRLVQHPDGTPTNPKETP